MSLPLIILCMDVLRMVLIINTTFILLLLNTSNPYVTIHSQPLDSLYRSHRPKWLCWSKVQHSYLQFHAFWPQHTLLHIIVKYISSSTTHSPLHIPSIHLSLCHLSTPIIRPLTCQIQLHSITCTNTITKSGQYRDAELPCHSVAFSTWCMTFKLTHFLEFLHHTYWNITHFRDRFGPILRLASCETAATI